MSRSIKRFLQQLAWLIWVCIPFSLYAQNTQPPVGPLPEVPADLQPGKPLVANVCPRFAVVGIPQKIKMYGKRLDHVTLKSEDPELLFSEYASDPDALAFSVLLESLSNSQPGKRSFMLQRSGEEPGPEVVLYLLKRADRALLQKDLARCPWMREAEDKSKKK